MDNKVAIVGTVAVIFLAVAAAGSWVWWKSHTPNALAREQVRAQLQNPTAARFEGLKGYPQNRSVCGYIMNRGPAGGYVQVARFIVVTEAGVRIEPLPGAQLALQPAAAPYAPNAAFAALLAQYCPNF